MSALGLAVWRKLLTFVRKKRNDVMGTYINTGNAGFQRARNSEYVDKSGLIGVINKTLLTEHCFTCVTRCRRFGKSMAAKMLNAYYDQSCDSRALFADLEITKDPSFEKYLNKFPVIYLDISDFVTRFHDEDIVRHIDSELTEDICKAYPNIPVEDIESVQVLKNGYGIYGPKGSNGVIIIKRSRTAFEATRRSSREKCVRGGMSVFCWRSV